MNRSRSMVGRNCLQSKEVHMEMEQVKDNLLNEARNKTSRHNKTWARSNHPSDYETLCNFADSERKERPYIHSVIKKMLDFKKTNKTLSKQILEKQKNICHKEKMILQLYEELNFHLNENSHLKANYENISILKNQVEHNKNGVTAYCQNLKKKFKHYVEIIDMYEDKISLLKKDREQLIKSCDHIINMKINDRSHIEEEMEKANRKIDFNVNMICELDEKLNMHKEEKEQERNRYLEIERVDRIKQEGLEKKYRELYKKSQEYQIIEDIRENEVVYAQMKISMDRADKENNEIKLKEYQLKNELLQKQVEEMSLRLTGFTHKTVEEPGRFDRLTSGKASTLRSGYSNSTRAFTNRDTFRSQSLRKSKI